MIIFYTIFLSLLSLGVQGVKFSDSTTSVFGNHNKGVVSAFGDFDADRFVDVFFLTPSSSIQNRNDVTVMLASDIGSYEFKVLISANVSSSNIIAMVPGDFNGDAQLDLLLCRDAGNEHVKLEVWWGNGNNLSDPTTIEGQFRDQPLIFNFNDDLIPDILVEDGDNNRTVILSSRSKDFEKRTFPSHPGTAPFTKPHSNAFISINNDYTADVLLTTEVGIEVWLRDDSTFHYDRLIPYPLENEGSNKAQQLSLADINENGHIDLLMPVCHNEDCTNCSIYVSEGNSTWHRLTDDHSFKDDHSDSWSFAPAEGHNVKYPITVRPGSYNMDGYMDLVMTLRRRNGDDGWLQKAFVMENTPCKSCTLGRTLRMIDESSLQNTANVALATFFDIYDDGVLDVLTVSYEESKPKVTLYSQSSTHDAYFIRIMVLSGTCYKNCSSSLYGVNPPGPMVEYKTTGLKGHKQKSIAGQLPQSAHFALNPPYTLFGLGPTSNFIDDVTVGIPMHGMKQDWFQIIPNSKLFVIPYPPDSPPKWIIKLFVTPSQRVMLTGAVLLGFMFIVAIIIAILQWKERREDMEEKRQDAHKFHFDAM